MESEQRVMIKFLANNGLGADAIEEKLRAQFAEDAYSLRTVQGWIAEVKRGREDLYDEPRPGGPLARDLTRRIQEVLNHNRFESAPSIVQVSHSTMLKYRHDNLGFRCFYLRWVAHLLTPELKK
jgi:transposase